MTRALRPVQGGSKPRQHLQRDLIAGDERDLADRLNGDVYRNSLVRVPGDSCYTQGVSSRHHRPVLVDLCTEIKLCSLVVAILQTHPYSQGTKTRLVRLNSRCAEGDDFCAGCSRRGTSSWCLVGDVHWTIPRPLPIDATTDYAGYDDESEKGLKNSVVHTHALRARRRYASRETIVN